MPDQMPGLYSSVPASVLGKWPRGTHHEEHGIVKSALMVLGIPHLHDGPDLLIMHGWQPLLEGLGLRITSEIGAVPSIGTDAKSQLEDRLNRLVGAKKITDEESSRVSELEQRRSIPRIAAETAARQQGKSIAETEQAGREAAATIPDDGPKDYDALAAAEILLDEHAVDLSLIHI